MFTTRSLNLASNRGRIQLWYIMILCTLQHGMSCARPPSGASGGDIFGWKWTLQKFKQVPLTASHLARYVHYFAKFFHTLQSMHTMSLLHDEKTHVSCAHLGRKGCSCFGRVCAQHPSRKRHNWWPHNLIETGATMDDYGWLWYNFYWWHCSIERLIDCDWIWQDCRQVSCLMCIIYLNINMII